MFSLERVELLAKQNGYKISNAERRLRELCDGENPSVRPIRTEKGHIMGYIYIEPPRPVIMNKPKQQTLLDVRMRD
ncbi:MAG: hypothetical protein CSYNP_03105 [Syntrophus sp. SKADARSKE-3]|nr:hypothetical protein [Syntrophus sp. SKADARSKE-3]